MFQDEIKQLQSLDPGFVPRNGYENQSELIEHFVKSQSDMMTNPGFKGIVKLIYKEHVIYYVGLGSDGIPGNADFVYMTNSEIKIFEQIDFVLTFTEVINMFSETLMPGQQDYLKEEFEKRSASEKEYESKMKELLSNGVANFTDQAHIRKLKNISGIKIKMNSINTYTVIVTD